MCSIFVVVLTLLLNVIIYEFTVMILLIISDYKTQKTTIYNNKKKVHKTKKSSEYIGDSSIIYQNPQGYSDYF